MRKIGLILLFVALLVMTMVTPAQVRAEPGLNIQAGVTVDLTRVNVTLENDGSDALVDVAGLCTWGTWGSLYYGEAWAGPVEDYPLLAGQRATILMPWDRIPALWGKCVVCMVVKDLDGRAQQFLTLYEGPPIGVAQSRKELPRLRAHVGTTWLSIQSEEGILEVVVQAGGEYIATYPGPESEFVLLTWPVPLAIGSPVEVTFVTPTKDFFSFELNVGDTIDNTTPRKQLKK